MALKIESDGTTTEVTCSDKTWSLNELHAVIGGWVEVVRYGANIDPGFIMVVDEEGLIKGLPFNIVATILAGQTIVGTALYGLATELDI